MTLSRASWIVRWAFYSDPDNLSDPPHSVTVLELALRCLLVSPLAWLVVMLVSTVGELVRWYDRVRPRVRMPEGPRIKLR